MGPLANEAQFAKVTDILERALGQGATAVCGGGPDPELGGYFVQPTILTDVGPDSPAVREEIFGPVVAAMPLHATRTRRSRRPTTPSTGSRAPSGRSTCGAPCAWRRGCAPAPCGSTPTAWSAPTCPSAASRRAASAARTGSTSCASTPRRSRCGSRRRAPRATRSRSVSSTGMSAHDLLRDRTIIVTGAATGIGQAFAVGCAEQGANVVVADLNPADETVALIERAGGSAHRGRGRRLRRRLDATRWRSAALERFGRIDGLVNNAAYFREVRLTPFERARPGGLGPHVRGQRQGRVAVLQGGAARDARAGERQHRQHRLGRRGRRPAGLPALRREQGRRALDDQGAGQGARAARRAGQRDRARASSSPGRPRTGPPSGSSRS